MIFYTYIHYKPDGTPFYVGKGSGRRAYEMVSRRRNRFHQRVVEKYGAGNITVRIFECETEDQAFKNEVAEIIRLKAEGYILANLTDGGEGPSNPCEETRKKMSLAKKGKTPWKGRHHSDETKAKMTIARRKRVASDSTKQKMSLAQTGRKHSAETKQKMAASAIAARKGKYHASTAKLTEEQVLRIRSDARPHRKIAVAYCMSKSQVTRIKQLRSWAHLGAS